MKVVCFIKPNCFAHVLLVWCLFIIPFASAQNQKNVITIFDLYVENSPIWGSLWKENETAQFFYWDKNDNLATARTVDTVLNFTREMLQKHFGLEIEALTIGPYRYDILGRFHGLPNNSVKKMLRHGNYENLFKLKVNLTIGRGFSQPPPNQTKNVSFKSGATLLIIIEQYDSNGDKVLRYKEKYYLTEKWLGDNRPLEEVPVEVSTARLIFALTGNQFFEIYELALQKTLKHSHK